MAKQLYQQCPNCESLQKTNAQFCSECSYALSSFKNVNSKRLVMLTILATIGILALVGLSFYLGSRLNKNETANQLNTAPQNPTLNNTNLAVNVNSNTNADNVNANLANNANSAPKEKKRSRKEATEIGWSYVAKSSDSLGGHYLFYKPNSVYRYNGEITVWAKQFPMYPRAFAKDNGLKTPVDYVLDKFHLYCLWNEFYIIDETFFDETGTSLKNQNNFRDQKIKPDTTIEALKLRVCGY